MPEPKGRQAFNIKRPVSTGLLSFCDDIKIERRKPPQAAASLLLSRCGSFQPGRMKWQV